MSDAWKYLQGLIPLIDYALNAHMVSWAMRYIFSLITNEPVHEISKNVVCATSKASDQPAHRHSLIRAFASCLSIV